MDRYINADKLHNQGWVAARYKNWEPTPLNENFRLEVEVKPFNTFPAADVQEVKHGRWIKKYRGNYLCSECGAWYRTKDDYGNIIDGEITANYCESCGAKMDGDTE